MALTWPVPLTAIITQYFATNAYSPVQPAGHTGMDFAVPVGTSIKAIGAGTVIWADWATKLSPSNIWYIAPAYAGIVVLIDHGNIVSVYAHLDSTPLNVGDKVTQGQEIAKSGNTGLSTGPHLHFEIFPDPIVPPVNWLANRVNPLNYITKTEYSPAPAPLKANQRRVGAFNVNLRSEPNTGATSKVLRIIKANTTEEFTGYVVGERVNGKNLWYRDAQGFAHCDGFMTQVTTGLPNLTPIPANWRKTGAAVAIRRAYPRLSANKLGELKANTDHVMKNWTTGDTWEGSNVWFEYRDGGWVHSKLFTSQATTGLTKVADPTPAPAPEPAPAPVPTIIKKTVVPEGVRLRSLPTTESISVVKSIISGGTIVTVNGFVTSQSVNGSDVWFTVDTGYIHSSGVTDASFAGLTKKPTPSIPVTPTAETYSFTKDFDFVEYIPANTWNMQNGNFPTRPQKVVLHQFDAKAKNPSIAGVISHFQTDRRPTGQSSAHFVVSGTRIVQMVSLKDRAFHAGPTAPEKNVRDTAGNLINGNDYIGIEIDPQEDPATVVSVKKLLTAIKQKYGYLPEYTEHQNVPNTATACGVDIHLEKYVLDTPKPEPVPEPQPEPVPEPVPVPDATVPSKETINFVLDYLLRENSK